jgi:glucose-1-phosphate thymidylyltransferase
MKCLIMAGGFATRLYPLTISRAKALLEYKGKPIINHLVNNIPSGMDIMVTINKRFEADFYHWQKNIDRKLEILVEEAPNEKSKMGAVSSLDYWIRHRSITEDLLVIAGDNYFEAGIVKFLDEYDGKHSLVAVYDVGDKDKAKPFGVVKLDGHRIIDLQEKPANPKSSMVATACYIFPQRVFPMIHGYCQQDKRDNLGSLIAHLIDSDAVYAHTFTEPWRDIGSEQDLI